MIELTKPALPQLCLMRECFDSKEQSSLWFFVWWPLTIFLYRLSSASGISLCYSFSSEVIWWLKGFSFPTQPPTFTEFIESMQSLRCVPSFKLCWKPMSPKSSNGEEKWKWKYVLAWLSKEIKFSIDVAQE